jgi:ubiquinone biosynthesis protein
LKSTAKIDEQQPQTEDGSTPVKHFALAQELFQIYRGLFLEGAIKTPIRFSKNLLIDSGLEPVWSEQRFLDLVGDMILRYFDALGPVYGKAGQVALSRLSGEWKKRAEQLRLSRLYGDWPHIPFQQIETILDEEVPEWHQSLVVEPYPIGVASMAQVHRATDEQGRRWVIKIIKPQAKRRLNETLDAMEQMLGVAKPLEVTSSGKRALRETRELIVALRQETELDREKLNIDRMREKLAQRKQQVLRLPETLDPFCTKNVLTVEMFDGTALSDVISGQANIPRDLRKKLAKKVLQEMLVQVFELGLFHGDPHAGNLILLKDGTVGVFDWGLTGELVDSDRRHISSLLKAVMGGNMEKLIDALEEMALESEVDVDRSEIEAEIRGLSQYVNDCRAEGKKPTLQELLERSLKSAETLQIPVPDGLLMMAKSLLTIEGLARGIDPEVAMGRIATPVLFKAAKPGFRDLVSFSKRLPKMAGQLVKGA